VGASVELPGIFRRLGLAEGFPALGHGGLLSTTVTRPCGSRDGDTRPLEPRRLPPHVKEARHAGRWPRHSREDWRPSSDIDGHASASLVVWRRWGAHGAHEEGHTMNTRMRPMPRQRQAARRTPNGFNARQQYERYLDRAREAQLSGDEVGMENWYQHAEHY